LDLRIAETAIAKLELMVEKVGPWGMIVVNSHDNIDNMLSRYGALSAKWRRRFG